MQARRAGLFVDITNQFYSTIHSHHGVLIDYQKYMERASEGFVLARAFAYGAQINNEAAGFVTALRNLGYEPRYRQAVMIQDKQDIRRTDRNMIMAMDIWRCIDKLDAIIIGSSDPDLSPLIVRVRELGVQTIIYSCNVSRELRETADRVIEVEPFVMTRRRDVSA